MKFNIIAYLIFNKTVFLNYAILPGSYEMIYDFPKKIAITEDLSVVADPVYVFLKYL